MEDSGSENEESIDNEDLENDEIVESKDGSEDDETVKDEETSKEEETVEDIEKSKDDEDNKDSEDKDERNSEDVVTVEIKEDPEINSPGSEILKRQSRALRPKSCDDWLTLSAKLKSGIYEIYKQNGEAFKTYCKMVRFFVELA